MDIWKELNAIELEEQAKFTDKGNLLAHHEKHPIIIDGVRITEDQYNQMCGELTKARASYIGSDAPIQGYIRQDGRKVKFRKFNNEYEFGVYAGDEITGSAVTYFIRPLRKIMEESNPYSILSDVDRRYKSDLDGKFNGLAKYVPPEYLSRKDFESIKNKILKGIKL